VVSEFKPGASGSMHEAGMPHSSSTMLPWELNELFGALSHFDDCAALIGISIPKTTYTCR
jgi:hypothetical protein